MTFSIRGHTAFSGPNIWDRRPVTHVVVDAGAIRAASWNVPDLSRWHSALAPLVLPGSSLEPVPVPGAADPGLTVALMALNLQRIAGVSVEFCTGRRRPEDSGYDAVIEHRHPEVGLAAARLAVSWLAQVLETAEAVSDLLEAFERFVVVVTSSGHGDTGRSLANAAAQRGIPLTAIDPRGRIVELGNGRYRKHLGGSVTSLTSAISVEISRDKHLTNYYLRAAGLPVPDSIVVRSVEQALAAARTIGYPVAIKPLDLGSALGVVLDLRNDGEVRASFDLAARAAATSTGKLLVERFIQGNDYRALIVNDRVLSVRRRVNPEITGDGARTVRQLIEAENADPRRGPRAVDVYKEIAIDEPVLQNLGRVGLALDSVPIQGQRIVLKLNGNRRDGAIHIDCTDDIHPENSTLLCAAANVIGLDIAGIDVITPDIARPLLETGGVILEINDSPGFNLHLFAQDGPSRDPGPTIIEMLFPPGQPVRVPVVAVMVDEDSPIICHVVAQTVALAGQAVGLATRDGLVVDGTRYPSADARNPSGPRTLLNNPLVEVAVVEVDAQSIVEHGLGFDPCDVVVILSLSGLKTPYGQPVETALLHALDPAGIAVLDAADPEILSLAADFRGPVIFVGLEADDSMLAPLLDQGHRAVVTRKAPAGAVLTIVSRDMTQDLLAIGLAKSQEDGGSAQISLAELQAAAAAAVGMHVPTGTIQQCLQPLADYAAPA